MMSREEMMEKFCDRYEKWDEENVNETRWLNWMAEQLGLDFPEFRIDENEGKKVNERVVNCCVSDEGFESDEDEEYVVPEHVESVVDEWMDEEADDEEEEDCAEKRDDRNLFIRMIWMVCEIARLK